MASDWSSDQLGNLVQFKTGKLNSNAAVPNGRYPFFTCSQETFRTDTCAFDTECVLLAGNNANGIYPLKYFKGKFDAYQRTYVITPLDTSRLNTRFLYYSMRPMLEHLQSISTGAATKFVTLTILNGLDFQYPPLPTQRKIASILSAYDDLIENNTRRIAILEEMAQAIYREWFVNFRFPGHENVKLVDSPLGQIPEGWGVKNLLSLAEVQYGFAFKSKQFNTERQGIPVVRIRDVLAGQSNTYSPETPDKKYLVEKGDILVGMDGIFHMGVWASDQAFLVQRVARFRSNGEIGRYHLFLSLQEPIRHFNATITGTTVAHLGDKHIKTIVILWPAEGLLRQLNDHLEPMLAEILNLRTKNTNLRTTRDLLLPKLISGKLDVEELDIDVGLTAEALEAATA